MAIARLKGWTISLKFLTKTRLNVTSERRKETITHGVWGTNVKLRRSQGQKTGIHGKTTHIYAGTGPFRRSNRYSQAILIVEKSIIISQNSDAIFSGRKSRKKSAVTGTLVFIHSPTNLSILPILPICKLANRFANGTINLKIIFEVCFLDVKHIQCYLTPCSFSN